VVRDEQVQKFVDDDLFAEAFRLGEQVGAEGEAAFGGAGGSF
jgi:hypothetical protein